MFGSYQNMRIETKTRKSAPKQGGRIWSEVVSQAKDGVFLQGTNNHGPCAENDGVSPCKADEPVGPAALIDGSRAKKVVTDSNDVILFQLLDRQKFEKNRNAAQSRSLATVEASRPQATFVDFLLLLL